MLPFFKEYVIIFQVMEMKESNTTKLIDSDLLTIIDKLRIEKINTENIIGTQNDAFKYNGVEYSIISMLPGVVGCQLLIEYKDIIKFEEKVKTIKNISLLIGNVAISLPINVGKKEIKNIRTYNSLSTRKSIDTKRKDFVLNYRSTFSSDLLELIEKLIVNLILDKELVPIYSEYYNFCLEVEKHRQINLSNKIRKIS